MFPGDVTANQLEVSRDATANQLDVYRDCQHILCGSVCKNLKIWLIVFNIWRARLRISRCAALNLHVVDVQIRIGQARGRYCEGCGHIWQSNIRSCAKTHKIWENHEIRQFPQIRPPDLPISLGINVPGLTTWSARCAQYLVIGGWFLASG